VGATVESAAGSCVAPAATSRLGAIDHAHLVTGVEEQPCRGETGDSRADDDDAGADGFG
jgi:hypothetical protein